MEETTVFKSINYALKLDATGFLRHVHQKNKEVTADIQIISNDAHCKEEVWVHCIIPRKYADYFIQLQNRLLEGSYVIISLEGFYNGMYSHSCSGPNEAHEQITVIEVQLAKLTETQINGDKVRRVGRPRNPIVSA